MPRATTVLATTTLVAGIASLWLYADNRSLRSELDAARAQKPAPEKVAAPVFEPVVEAARTGPSRATWRPPVLPTVNEESQLDKRARRQETMTAMLGRIDGESDDAYRNRLLPLLKAGLAVPRMRAENMRKLAEDKAHVTTVQSQQLDQSFQKVYSDVLAYSNKAIGDGTVSPYERNVANWLEFAGGLGTILQDANGQIAHILSADQMKAMYDTGFEWGEYLGVEAPWEKLDPPPAPPAPKR